MNEIQTDPVWREPMRTKIFAQLQLLNEITHGEAGSWLARAGFKGLIQCAACLGEEFTHRDRCPLNDRINEILEKARHSSVQELGTEVAKLANQRPPRS